MWCRAVDSRTLTTIQLHVHVHDLSKLEQVDVMNALTSMQSVAEQPLLELTLRHVTVILDHAHHRTAQVRRVADVTRARVGCALEQEVDEATQRKTVQEKRSAYYANI